MKRNSYVTYRNVTPTVTLTVPYHPPLKEGVIDTLRNSYGGPRVFQEKPTLEQVKSVSKMCMILHIDEPLEEKLSTMNEARALLFQLRGELNARKSATGRTAGELLWRRYG